MRARCQIPGLLQAGAQIVDMRSPNEFAAGHASRSLNIPLSDLHQRVIELNG
jgi:rhodanese-related sulfurtransferase